MAEVEIRAANPSEQALWTQSRSARPTGPEPTQTTLFTLVVDDAAVGFIAISIVAEDGPAVGRIDDIWIAPEARRQGYAATALAFAERWCREHVHEIVVTIDPNDPAHQGLFDEYPLRRQQMHKAVDPSVTLPEGVRGRPMTEAEYGPWLELDVQAYADELVGTGMLAPVDALARSRRDYEELLPEGLRSPDRPLWILTANDEPVATLWLMHHLSPGLTWVASVEVRPEHRGRGHGRSVMRFAEQAARAAGDPIIGLNVFGNNSVAMSLYESLGYRATAQTRSVPVAPTLASS